MTVNDVQSALGWQVHPFLRDVIEAHHSTYIRRYDKQCDGVQSIIKLLQLYSDKLNTSLKVSGLTLYPVTVNVMKCSKSLQNFMSSYGHRIIAC